MKLRWIVAIALLSNLIACESLMVRRQVKTVPAEVEAAPPAEASVKPEPKPVNQTRIPRTPNAPAASDSQAKPEKKGDLTASPNAATPPHSTEDFWSDVVASRRFTDCAYDPAIESWAKRLTSSPAHFNANAKRILPYFDFVWRRVREMDMPAEVAFLPLVESDYRQVYGSYGSPGGWWQIMPAVGKGFKLDVSRNNDERVDPVKATRVAIALMQENADRFQQDWLVSIFAYNVGGQRVQRQLDSLGLSAGQIEHVSQLGLPQTTSDHLHRMIAWGCIFADPKRYGVTLPPGLSDEERFIEVRIKQTTPIAAMAATLGGSSEEWKRQHPLITKRGEIRYGQTVLAPKAINDRIAALGNLRPYREAAKPAAVLAAATTSSKAAVPAATGSRSNAARSRSTHTTKKVVAVPAQYKVRNGDNLWTIARRFDMRVKEILVLNPKVSRDRLLKLGQVLKLK
jgi:membrane-bound lytic murein transglycosylase D